MTDEVDCVTQEKDFQNNSSVKNTRIISNMESSLKDRVKYSKIKWILLGENAGNSAWQNITWGRIIGNIIVC